MPRHRWRESVKSFIGSYIDPEKVEELRGTKSEIDGKVKRILRSLKEDANDNRKESVADLIENFNNHYQSLYTRYDRLVEKLSKTALGKNGKDISVSSSDSSDSDDSPIKTGEEAGDNTAVIKQELETALSEVGDLRGKLAAASDEKEALMTENVDLKLKVNELTEEVDAKNQEINRLEENNEELNTELEIKADEMSTLIENMRATEVNQRLTSRKLHVTEQVLGEKEENHRRSVEKFLEERKLLEEKLAAYKEAQVKTVNEISEKVSESFMGIDNLSVKFEEDYGHLESRVYEIVNELKVMVNWVGVNNSEKDRLKNEIDGLVREAKDGKERELVLTVKVGEMETMLGQGEDERRSLIQTVKERELKMAEMEKMVEKKIGEMEREVRERESRILSLGEEKREAIRQLCIWIDYYYDRYAIVKNRGERRQIAA
ncbi:hypothetical protein PHJA_000813900 [Phtheirospermum japonicum]|uniref:NAB domain-containing protein n=1 Tax=Phtheirospermum japonicum TaxID=374723 RepID=A0A830BX86_9LAMI|nr:hypothetical protein PHJA_000813900 [Phtheirospermum japonicum]